MEGGYRPTHCIHGAGQDTEHSRTASHTPLLYVSSPQSVTQHFISGLFKQRPVYVTDVFQGRSL